MRNNAYYTGSRGEEDGRGAGEPLTKTLHVVDAREEFHVVNHEMA